jgi:hypothetical protein
VRRTVLFALVACAAVVLPAVPAYGWANGGDSGNGFGTHDWVLQEANRFAGKKGAGWVNLKAALPRTDDPDTQFHDTYYHVYDVWGDTYGNAPQKIALYYDRALAQRRRGEYAAASRSVGLMAHYYADICNPLHTDQTGAEERVHGNYESAVETRTDAVGENRRWLRFNGYDKVVSITVRAKSAAASAHPSYTALVSHYDDHGYDSTVSLITRKAMNRAVNGLADIIITLRRLAPPK